MLPLKLPPNKYLKRFAIAAIAIILLYAGIRIYINSMLKSVIISQVEQLADHNYKLELHSVYLGYWAFNVKIDGLKLSKVSKANQPNEPILFTLAASHVKLKGLSLFDLLINKKLQLNKLEMTDPSIVIFYNDTLKPVQKAKTVSDIALNYHLSKVQFSNAKIQIKKSSGSNISLSSKKVVFDLISGLMLLEESKITSKSEVEIQYQVICKLNKLLLTEFNINEFLNESKLNYATCIIDSIDLHLNNNHKNVLQHQDSMLKSRDAFTIPVSYVKFKYAKLTYTLGQTQIVSSAKDVIYNKKQLSMYDIQLSIQNQHFIESNIYQIKLIGFDAEAYLKNKESSIGKMIIINPNISINLAVKKAVPVAANFKSKLNALGIAEILELKISNGSFSLKQSTAKALILQVDAINLFAQNIYPDFRNSADKKDLVKNLSMYIGSSFWNFPNNLYHLNLQSASYQLKKEILTIKALSINPNYTKSKFHSIVKKQVAMINLDLELLTASGYNLNDFINENQFLCKEIIAENLKVTFYKNKNIPLLESEYKKFPQELIREIAYPIAIEKLTVKDAELVSEILNVGSKYIAKITVDQVKAEFNHINNRIFKGNKMDITFEGRIANSGMLKAKANLDMYASDFKHTVHAEIGKMPFKNLNEFMFDFAGIEISDGTMDKAIIDIKGNRQKLHCKLNLSYHDLGMDILKNQNRNKKIYRNIASILANSIIIDQNPEPYKPLRISTIEQAYIPNKFIVGNWINVSLKAMLLTTTPTAASALNINNFNEDGSDPKVQNPAPKWLKKMLKRKRIK